MSTGPQTYPGASTAYWYASKYAGDAMEVNVVVLHTTEGRTLPDYDGGAVAPTLTAVPDFAAKKLRWYQHFPIDTSARALVNLPGGVETNTNNVCQLEMVGTCDPATRTEWVKAGKRQNVDFIYWPEAPDWALQGVAEFLAWMHEKHGVPLTGPSSWPAYPSSYGASNGVRMNDAQWNAFKGVCGHMHVDENLHGDPGAIDFAHLLALAKGITTSTQEDNVALTDDDIKKIGRQVVTGANGAKSPDDPTVEWAVSSFLGLTYKTARTIAADVAAVKTKVEALAVGGIDLDALAERVADKLAARLAE